MALWLWIVIGTPVGALLLFVLLSKAYSRMLIEAHVPWYLSPPVGEIMLYILLQISTRTRSLANKAMGAAGREKAKLLAIQNPGPGGVCFVGSSTFTFWRNIEKDFSELGLPIINAAFGGSRSHDVLALVDCLCNRFKPSIIVYFCGSNNITQGLPTSTVLEDFQSFVSIVASANPRVQVIYLGITTTPFCRKTDINACLHRIKISNEELHAFCKACKNAIFAHTEETDSWLSNEEYYLADRHHLNDEGHRLLAQKVLLPAIKIAIQRQLSS